MKGNFHLKRGEVLTILVGHEGGVNTVSGGTGGGGGTFVATDGNTPLLVGKFAVDSFSNLYLGKMIRSLSKASAMKTSAIQKLI